MDRYTLYSGNPYLRPSFAYSTELSNVYNNQITATVLWNYQSDLIQETIQQDSSNFFSRPGNFGKTISYGASIYASFQWKSKWMFQCYTAVRKNEVTSNLYGNTLRNSGVYWYIGPVLIYSGNKGWSAELSGSYTTDMAFGQFRTIAVGSANVGISIKVLKEKGTIKLALDDVLYSLKPGGEILAIGNSYAVWNSRFDSRVLTLSFSYRFSKGQSLKSRSAGGADAEKSRVK